MQLNPRKALAAARRRSAALQLAKTRRRRRRAAAAAEKRGVSGEESISRASVSGVAVIWLQLGGRNVPGWLYKSSNRGGISLAGQ